MYMKAKQINNIQRTNTQTQNCVFGYTQLLLIIEGNKPFQGFQGLK